MTKIVIGIIICIIAIILRAVLYKSRNFKIDCKYIYLIIFCIIGNFLCFLGFFDFTQAPANITVDYSSVLTILSLLAAGLIAGNFSFSYQEAAVDERFMPNIISILFMILFPVIFGAVSFYMGKSQQVSKAEYFYFIAPLIMFLILSANTLYNFWDYRQVDEEKNL